MKFLKTLLVILIISVTFGGAMFGLNFITGPRIEANKAGAELAPLLAVMPEGAEFGGDALLYSSENASASTLTNVPTNVLSIYKEKNGLGFVVRCTAETEYSAIPMEITVGISADGKICGIQIDNYGEKADANYNNRLDKDEHLGSYLGKDSTLVDTTIVAGATTSSKAFKKAVASAMEALAVNNLIVAATKSDDLILADILAEKTTGFDKFTSVSVSGNITYAVKSGIDAGFAYAISENGTSYFVVVNATGAAVVYDADGNDVTSAHSAVVVEAKAHASANQTSYNTNLTTKVAELIADASNFVNIEVSANNTVVSAAKFNVGDAVYYAFLSRVYGYKNVVMDVYYVLDSTGAIVKVETETLFFGEEHYSGNKYQGVPENYKDGYVGETLDSWTGDKAIITGATVSSNAMKKATLHVFDAFNSIKGGQQ